MQPALESRQVAIRDLIAVRPPEWFTSGLLLLPVEPILYSHAYRHSLIKVLLHLRQNFCFFGLQEFFVQLLFGSAELKVKSVNALLRDSMLSILSSLVIPKANTKYPTLAFNIAVMSCENSSSLNAGR